MSKLEETNLLIESMTKAKEAKLDIDNTVVLLDIAKSLAMIADKLCGAEREGYMVINRENKKKTENVEFISYSGKYPCLCFGELALRICGEECVFGHSSIARDAETGKYIDGHYDRFWSSGGIAGFNGDYSEGYVSQAEWIVDVEKLPEKFKKYADEIDRVFNDNVEHGCCGGCL